MAERIDHVVDYTDWGAVSMWVVVGSLEDLAHTLRVEFEERFCESMFVIEFTVEFVGDAFAHRWLVWCECGFLVAG